ncbi:hypothetical protein HP546_11015 [Pseudomonas sp. CM25]|uniref:hypothetical protein n=1 Tax=unclassified Pseudomonas TaxID=196821 RepID=UPI001552EC5C|nr:MULTISPECIES: hypothetical protein [unclassified Pseudomonas]NQD55878.1 hypothetical protein [Pseudomonas sp. CM25]NQD74967.1 hypothetical protein [Pseudomonas sp. CM27]HEN8799907.1 hypothetical protein [Pseudomonas putida]
MQQRKDGATLFQLQVAPSATFSDKAAFLLLLGASTAIFRRKSNQNGPFGHMEKSVGRVAPNKRKIPVAPGCT